MKTIFEQRREWVNAEFARLTTGQPYNTAQKTKILRKLWKDAKRKYK